MPAAPDLQSLADAAEHAASAGDFAAAEQHLRLAVELQEASAGPMHPDLANALNNLGVVCERIGKSADAEGCYRRAYAIASTVLPADHPFVALSARNLRDFCEARGIPFEQPVAPLPAPALAEKAVGPDFSRARKPEAVSPPPQPVQHPRRGLAVAAALGALALIAIAIVATRSRSTSSPAAAAPSVPSPAASTVAPRNPAPVAETPAPSAPAPVAPDARNAPDAPDARGAPAVSVAPTLVSAELCRRLETSGSEWRCAPANGVLQPGTFVFYTRVASPTDATIEHRWYRNDRLHQTVPLRVRANQRNGFRTYSRMTVSADRTGEWRVELRTRNGDILHEERFTVAP